MKTNIVINPLLLACVTVLQLLTFPLSVDADPDHVNVRHYLEQDLVKIVFEWPDPVPYRASVDEADLASLETKDGRELFLSFARGIQAPMIESIPKEIPQWIETIKLGYDSVLLRTRNLSSFHVVSDGRTITVQIRRAGSKKDDKGTVLQARQLDELKGALIVRQSEPLSAQAQLSELLEGHPDSHDLALDLAAVEAQLHRWRQGLKLYDRALVADPGSPTIKQSRSELLRLHGSQIRFDQFYQNIANEEIQWISLLTGYYNFSKGYTFGIEYDYRVIDDNQSRPLANGTLRVFEGNREKWKLYLEKSYGFSTTRLALLGQENDPGFGITHRQQLPVGELILNGAINEPYWGFVEGIINGGTADRISAFWNYEGKFPLHGYLGTRLNNYNVEENDDVAESVELLFEIRYPLHQIHKRLSVAYSLDAEYANQTERLIDSAGQSFSPLPVISTQLHSWYFSFYNNLSTTAGYDLRVGYAYDNLVDSKGPLVNFHMYCLPAPHWEIGMNVDFADLSARGTANAFTQVGTYVIWRL